VLDETMGDDVKITVIATGFRQGSINRSDDIAAAAQPSAARPASRGQATPQAPSAKPRFASEVEGEVDAPFATPIAQRSALVAEPEPIAVASPNTSAGQSLPGTHAQSVASPAISEPEPFAEEELEIPAYLRRGGN
jgi:cell division protein FtsZ